MFDAFDSSCYSYQKKKKKKEKKKRFIGVRTFAKHSTYDKNRS